MTYHHVQPHDHEAGCRRGTEPYRRYNGLDRERCLRCRNLWARLLSVGYARRGRSVSAS